MQMNCQLQITYLQYYKFFSVVRQEAKLAKCLMNEIKEVTQSQEPLHVCKYLSNQELQ